MVVVIVLDVTGCCCLVWTSGLEGCGVTVVAGVVVLFLSVAAEILTVVVVKAGGGCGFDEVESCGCVAVKLIVVGVVGLVRSVTTFQSSKLHQLSAINLNVCQLN